MDIRRIKLDQLLPADRFRLSFPPAPGAWEELQKKLAPLPLIHINSAGEIFSGHDYYTFLKDRGADETDVLCLEVTDKQALFLAYNLKEKFTGLNTYEKLVFIKKIIPLAQPREIYGHTSLDISINRGLTKHLDLLLAEEFQPVLTGDKIHLKSALKLCAFGGADRHTLLELFGGVDFTNSHQQKLLEMTEELMFREKRPLADIFKQLDIESLLEQSKPQKSIIDKIFTFRNPLVSSAEEQWQRELKELNLPPNIRVSHYPFFEKKQLDITVSVENTGQFKHLIKRIQDLPGT